MKRPLSLLNKEASFIPIPSDEDLMTLHVFLLLLVLVLMFSLARGCVSFAGPIMTLPSRQQQPSAPHSTVSSSLAPHTIAPPVASPPPTRRLWNQRLCLCAPGARSKAGGEPRSE